MESVREDAPAGISRSGDHARCHIPRGRSLVFLFPCDSSCGRHSLLWGTTGLSIRRLRSTRFRTVQKSALQSFGEESSQTRT